MHCYTGCMTTLASDSPVPGAVAGQAAADRLPLRERKKLATRRRMRRIALTLIAQRGFAHVTVEDIAEAAEVSPRTFFNYFPSKEAVLFGPDPDRFEDMREHLLADQPGAPAFTVLRAVLVEQAAHIADELSELGDDPTEWVRLMRLAHADSHLRAAQASSLAVFEASMAEAVAERLGTDPARDPYPLLLAGAAMSVMRSSISFWGRTGGAVPLAELVGSAFAALAGGLPEDCALRSLAARADPAGCDPAGLDSLSAPPPSDPDDRAATHRKDHQS
jgi:AcrR family transcriptional regulator